MAKPLISRAPIYILHDLLIKMRCSAVLQNCLWIPVTESYRIQVCVGSSFWNCYLLWLMTLALVLMNHQTVANNFSWRLNTNYLPTLGHVHIAHTSPLSDLVWTLLEWAVTVGTGHALLKWAVTRYWPCTSGMGSNCRYWPCTPLGFYMRYVGSCLLTWWDNILIASSKV